ncbi:MAG: DUF1674 domain-containing protein [Xanthomonadales bacterium]|nr:DUF1674 domain-containing protein [Xanthomonadaceae bacterium]MBN8223712.1 DUF1674 domain-containing protein [Xanthomonadales bacterium]MCA0198187.1 DUF1674 domain-containing protein [Pseudomonadota bacterium]
MIGQSPQVPEPAALPADGTRPSAGEAAPAAAREIDGRPGPEPTRYGDWEKNGRCIDF